MQKTIQLKSIGYNIYFGSDFAPLSKLIETEQYNKIVVLTDEHTTAFCLPLIKEYLEKLPNPKKYIEIKSGEKNKTMDAVLHVCSTMITNKIDRKSLVLNVGGGVLGDLGGFAASIFKRGIDFVQIPTTLLSQVDASVGGKTGIDFQHIKNIIGTFTQPKAVWINRQFLNTLPEREWLSGFAEIIKHALIKDAAFFDTIEKIELPNLDEEILYRAVCIKNDVVKNDTFEQEERKILNYGHTVGHAIEAYSLMYSQNPLTHGEAIASGMIYENRIACHLGLLSNNESQKINQVIQKHFPLYRIKKEQLNTLIAFMDNDKKNDNEEIQFSLLHSIGDCHYDIKVNRSLLYDALIHS